MRHPLAFLLVCAAAHVPTATAQRSVTTEPQGIDADFPDPAVLRTARGYFAYATNARGKNVQVAHSIDLAQWEHLPDALPHLPSWASPAFGLSWAPEVFETRGDDGAPRFVMYFTARCETAACKGQQAIGTAVGTQPSGPFLPDERGPFICQSTEGGTIDAAPFLDDDGTRYVVFKNDGNAQGKRTWLSVQRTSSDGLTLVGDPVRVLTVDQDWEGPLVEGPTLWKRNGKYFLFYSANDYAGEHYAVGYASSGSVMGPYVKAGPPLLATDAARGLRGPGGQALVDGSGGITWFFFHNWKNSEHRGMRIARLQWEGDVPVVELPSPGDR